MKQLIISFLFILFTTYSSSAQFGGLQPIAAFEDVPGNPLQEYVKTYRHTEIPREFEGSYYLHEEFEPGQIVVEGKNRRLNVLLRYNALADVVEVKLDKKKDSIYVLPAHENIIYKVPRNSYRYDTYKTKDGEVVNGYFIYYYEGEKLQFLSKPRAHLQDEVEPRSGYDRYKPAKFSVKQFYYLLDENGSLKEVNLKEKDFRKILSQNKEMRKYFSENKVKTVEDVVAMLEFYEQQ